MLGRFPAKSGIQCIVLELRLEKKEDWWEVEALFDLCFAPGREALPSYRMRDNISPIPDLCFLVRDELGVLGGAIRFWEIDVNGYAALLLGPVAVHPTRQGEGLGGFLMRESLNHAKIARWKRVMLVGDYAYYSRFGFFKLENVHMPPPTNPERVLGYAISDGAWDRVFGEVRKKP